MTVKVCTNCGKEPHSARGLCHLCYNYQRRTGKPRPKNIALLSADDIIEAIARYVNNLTPMADLADEYGVSLKMMHAAFAGKTKAYQGIEDRIPVRHLRALMAYRKKYGRRKLTPAQARNIRHKHVAGKSRGILAMEYKVGKQVISRIVRGITYKEAGGPIVERQEKYITNRGVR